ncbi:MAG: RNB domain-containing ribonuclease [Burkholderiaceae bacterium]|jgi:exoribonuclease-2|nr:RNB domain-containing ribonuclease [Burkholderiaceae bacterium]
MFVLFEEAGQYLGARVLSGTETSAQVELDSGKRLKVKAASIVLRFEQPAAAQLLDEARALAATVDLDLAWEFAPEGEFGFADLAADYFGDQPALAQQAAALLALFGAPHYFRRAGKGRFKKAPAEIVRQALAAIEKKKAVQAQIDAWAEQLAAGQCPDAVREQLYKILFKPDKNAPEYKAVVHASRATQQAPLALLERAGAIDSAYQFHWRRFLFENFPKGTGFAAQAMQAASALGGAAGVPGDLPLAAVRAFSIDDSLTTEIDDALSVHGLGSGTVTVGIHIAAPGLVLAPGDVLDQAARARMSTVYMPGYKITMLPDAVVSACTLEAGRDCPAVSLYVQLDEASLAVQSSQSRLERVPIAANLRHDQVEAGITEDWLAGRHGASAEAVPVPEPAAALRAELSFLHRLAQALKAQREEVRGKPESFNRPDYTFRLSTPLGAEGAPEGSERVEISTRRRGAPLDLIVSETMILANSTWGGWLASLGVPAIYRSQASLAPGIKVRMGTRALPHAGLGVKSYAWSTSPLRRYTDLVNQWQLITAIRHGQTAALAAPFKPRDSALLAVVSGFEAAHTAYHAFQSAIERFWTLRYLAQEGITELEATILRDLPPAPMLARAETLPLVFSVLGAQGLARGARVRVRLGEIDEIALDVHTKLIERLDDANATASAARAGDEEADEADGADAAAAGPITIAVDLSEDEAPTVPPAAQTA